MKPIITEEAIARFLGKPPFLEGDWLEGAWQHFRGEHGIGDGIVNRKKFIRILPAAMEEVMARN